MNHDQFIDMCILCGCDYCPTIPKIGPVRAMKLIQKYGSIDVFLETDKTKDIDEFKSKYQVSRGLFKIFDGKIDLENLPIHNSEYDSERFMII